QKRRRSPERTCPPTAAARPSAMKRGFRRVPLTTVGPVGNLSLTDESGKSKICCHLPVLLHRFGAQSGAACLKLTWDSGPSTLGRCQRISVEGHKQKCGLHRPKSGSPPKADMDQYGHDVR